MARFEELQQLWQQQPERGISRRAAAELTHAFRRYGRRNDWIGVAMGAFDTPTETSLRIHIHVADKGDYYDIADGLVQNQY